ncbi:YwqH-like family protein [Ligilactobacillus acidipiscis]|uniref:YwqH-like family protein n=1 Tax=Ligilactobacillus acidipiscis TaxID=89059 RepID=UPI0023F9EA9C|nr:DUF5082 family protein [Ligilactobacillus acidipiscis]WEV56416.1 DUF5082 family protein [Ligilactobacillus acidipiscis]
MKASKRKAIRAKQEKIEKLENAITALELEKNAISHYKTKGIADAGDKEWKGNEKDKFNQEYNDFLLSVVKINNAIDTAIDDFQSESTDLSSSIISDYGVKIPSNPY